MYRYRHNDVPKWYLACTEVVQQKTHVPKWISYVPKSSCTESVHPFVPKLSCTESDVTRLKHYIFVVYLSMLDLYWRYVLGVG